MFKSPGRPFLAEHTGAMRLRRQRAKWSRTRGTFLLVGRVERSGRRRIGT